MAGTNDAICRQYAYDLRRLCDTSDTEGYVKLPDLLDELGVGQGFYVPCSTVEHLAGLIDRPTCRAVREAPSGFYVCDRCGADVWADADSVTRFCPVCGAEVCDV